MRRTPDELLTEAFELPEDARARLAHSLIASLDVSDEETDPAVIEQAWFAEMRRRAAEIDSGEVHTRLATEVFHAARAELQELRARRTHHS